MDKAERDRDQARTDKQKAEKEKRTEENDGQLLAKNVRMETELKMEEKRRQRLEKKILKLIDSERKMKG